MELDINEAAISSMELDYTPDIATSSVPSIDQSKVNTRSSMRLPNEILSKIFPYELHCLEGILNLLLALAVDKNSSTGRRT
jgi:hypothetical protein